MIERIPDQIPVQTGEWRGTTFDIIPKETFAMACRKINELADTVNELHEEAENNARIRANHEKLIDTLVEENNIHEKQIDELQMILEPEKCENPADNSEKANCQENVRPDYVTTTYVTDGHIKEYYGQNGASIVTDRPLPAGYVITIRESETKGGDNE